MIILGVKMSVILIAGRDWSARALLRAQLIEEGFDVEAYETVGDVVQKLSRGRTAPLLLVVDLFENECPAKDVAMLSRWSKFVPIWILAGHATAQTEELDVQGFEKVLLRPVDVGWMVREIKGRLARCRR